MKVYSPEMAPLKDQDIKSGAVGYSTMFYTFKEALKEYDIELLAEKGEGHHCNIVGLPWVKRCAEAYKVNGKRFVFTMWESSIVPTEQVQAINEHYDVLFVPNKFNKESFKNCGVKIPIEVVPLGINPTYYNIKKRKKEEEFKFLHYNAGEARKGWHELYEAFMEEFQDEDNVKLIAKNSGHMSKQIDASLKGLEKKLLDKVIIIKERLELDKMIELLHSANCFVFPAKGEGYGLTPREALATGCPTIVLNAHSFKELNDNYIKVKAEECKGLYANKDKWKYGQLSGMSYLGDVYKQLPMYQADISELRKVMRDVYENYNKYAKKAFEAAERVKEDEDIKKHANLFARILTKHIAG